MGTMFQPPSQSLSWSKLEFPRGVETGGVGKDEVTFPLLGIQTSRQEVP